MTEGRDRARPAPADEARLARNLAGVRRRQLRRRIRRAWLAGAGAVCIAVGLLIAAGVLQGPVRPSSGPLRSRAQSEGRLQLEAAATAPRAVELSDGSSLELGAAADVSVIDNSGERFRTLLARGWVRYAVRPGGPRLWIVETGLFQVEVVGTAFTVSRKEHSASIAVHRGQVLVRGPEVPGALQQLHAGQRLEVRAPRARASHARAADGVSAGRASAEGKAPPAALEAPRAAGAEPVIDRAIARRAAPAVAYGDAADAPAKPLPAAIPGTPSEETSDPLTRALRRADELRAAGRSGDAADVLEEALARHPDEPGAALATLVLARLQLALPARAHRAAASLQQAIRLGLPFGLREQAMALRVRALHESGRQAAARDAANAYRQAFPDGSWAARVGAWSEHAGPPRDP